MNKIVQGKPICFRPNDGTQHTAHNAQRYWLFAEVNNNQVRNATPVSSRKLAAEGFPVHLSPSQIYFNKPEMNIDVTNFHPFGELCSYFVPDKTRKAGTKPEPVRNSAIYMFRADQYNFVIDKLASSTAGHYVIDCASGRPLHTDMLHFDRKHFIDSDTYVTPTDIPSEISVMPNAPIEPVVTAQLDPESTSTDVIVADMPNSANDSAAPSTSARTSDAAISQPPPTPTSIRDVVNDLIIKDVSIIWNPDKAKKPIGGKITKSYQRYIAYSKAKTTKEYFQLHEGSLADAKRDFYYDVRKKVVLFDDDVYSKLQLLFSSVQDMSTAMDVSLYSMYMSPLIAHVDTLRDAMLCGIDEHQSNPIIQNDCECSFDMETIDHALLMRSDFEQVREMIVDSVTCTKGESMANHDNLYEYISLYANHWHTIADDPLSTSHPAEDVCLHLLTGDNCDVSVQDIHVGSLKDFHGAEREMMIHAIAKEVADLISIGTFELILDHNWRTKIPTKLVLKMKYRADGALDKPKARLVGLGFFQKLGKDFHATFAPMGNFVNVRLLVSLACDNGWDILHADVPQAFLKSEMDTDVCITLPKGVSINDRVTGDDLLKHNMVIKLCKSLYGLKQAGQLWNKEINNFLTNELGFTRSACESCLYHKFDPDTSKSCILLLEVDDMVVTGSSDDMIEEFHQQLESKYGLGVSTNKIAWEPISSFLGVNIAYNRSHRRLTMDVEFKIDTLLGTYSESFGCLWVKATPSPESVDKTRINPVVLTCVRDNYASIVGSLIYDMVACRPDISFAVGRLARHMHTPTDDAAAECAHLLAYLKQTKSLKLLYQSGPTNKYALFRHSVSSANPSTDLRAELSLSSPLTACTDADLAGASFDESRKSTSGFCIFQLNHLISWKSKLQPITAASTHESELIALAFGSDEIMWIRKQLIELHFCYPDCLVSKNSELRRAEGLLDDLHFDAGLLKGSLKEEAYKGDKTVTGFEKYDRLTWHDDMRVPQLFKPTVVLTDNQPVSQTVNNPDTSSQRSRHLDIRLFRVRDYIVHSALRVVHCRTECNIADMFTKALTKVAFRRLRDTFMTSEPWGIKSMFMFFMDHS